jgi:hypothetical protein
MGKNTELRVVVPGLVFLLVMGCAVTPTDHRHRVDKQAETHAGSRLTLLG